MEGEDQIVKRYIEAECEHRLTLFMSYPPLRNRFIDIDLNEKRIPGGRIRKRKMLLKRVFGLKDNGNGSAVLKDQTEVNNEDLGDILYYEPSQNKSSTP